MAAPYTIDGDSFVSDKPRVWSEKRLAVTLYSGPNFDLASDGKRIVALVPVEVPDEQTSRNHVIFVENFFDEVRRRTQPR